MIYECYAQMLHKGCSQNICKDCAIIISSDQTLPIFEEEMHPPVPAPAPVPQVPAEPPGPLLYNLLMGGGLSTRVPC